MSWSDWQDPWLAPRDITTSGKYFAYNVGTASSTTETFAELAADAKATILGGGGTPGTSWGASEEIAASSGSRSGSTNAAAVRLGYTAEVFNGADGEPFLPNGTPPLLEAGTLGVDYDYIPTSEATSNTTGFVDYESGGQTFDHWDVFYGSFLLRISMTASFGVLVPDSLTIPLRFWGSDALTTHAGDAVDGPAYGYAPSGVIGDFDFDALGDPGFNRDYYSNITPLDISGQAEAFTLVTQCRWQGDVDPWTTEITTSGSSYQLSVFTRGTGSAACMGRYTTPRWRYWIPDNKLRTIGDHFRSVGGPQIRSLVAGDWVPVRRGT